MQIEFISTVILKGHRRYTDSLHQELKVTTLFKLILSVQGCMRMVKE